MPDWSGRDSASWWSAAWIWGSKCSFNFEEKFCSRCISKQDSKLRMWLSPWSQGHPCFFCRKVGMCTEHLCDCPILYCIQGLGLWADALHGSTRLIFFLQYIHSYILQKKDKPRTAVQSIGPQTKLLPGSIQFIDNDSERFLQKGEGRNMSCWGFL